jgi:arabinofuranan 3-O-arabinosyltransferase
MRAINPSRRRPEISAELVSAVAFGLAVGYAGAMLATFLSHIWILDEHGHRVVEDFAAFWTAGRQALRGAAIAAYDPHLEHAAEVATIGHSFPGTLGWSYPPVFLFVAAALATLPYTESFLLWGAATLGIYALAVAAIVKRPLAFLVACAAPWVLTALMPGQNGFLTAALVGAALLSIEKRPALAGLFLGLLSYKPQLGVLFPLALACAGYWRVFGWALACTLLLNLFAGAVFGFGTIGAFVHALSGTTQSHLAHAGVGWNKLQSAYGLLRSLGAPPSAAWAGQGLVSLSLAMVISLCWRSTAPFELKAAALAAAIPLVTPYVFVYDLPLLAIPCAFVFKHRPFDRTEVWLIAVTAPCIFAFLWIPFPSAIGASLAVAAIVVRRILEGTELKVPHLRPAAQT